MAFAECGKLFSKNMFTNQNNISGTHGDKQISR